MQIDYRQTRWVPWLLVLGLVLTQAGCRAYGPPCPGQIHQRGWVPAEAPRELNKVVLPPYVIEPPDILSIDAVNIVPKSPYRLRMLDKVVIQVENALPEAPIAGVISVESGGILQLGPPYGTVKIAGMTVDEARQAIDQHLRDYLKNPRVTLSLAEMSGKQQIAGEHLVAPDGTVTLGSYGSVSLVGRTIPEAKAIIEAHLSEYLESPEVSVQVFAYNSKVFYVITQGLGAGVGDRVTRIPVMGNETVLDAVGDVAGLSPTSSTQVWIARPGPNPQGCDQILPVDWLAITQRGDVSTNYQVLPGDRVYVAENKWVAFDNTLSQFTAPFERVMGFSLLGVGTVTRFSGPVLRGGGAGSQF